MSNTEEDQRDTADSGPGTAGHARSPSPTLPELSSLAIQEAEDSNPELRQPRAHDSRSTMDAPTPFTYTPSPIPGRSSPRNRSPYSRGRHGHSNSLNSPLSAPMMVRAHSSPTSSTRTTLSSSLRSTSPFQSPGRLRSPHRLASEDEPSALTSPSTIFDIEVISEDSELDLTPRVNMVERASLSHHSANQGPPILALNSNNLPARPRRRPASPLHQVSNASFLGSSGPTSAVGGSSPLFGATKFNEVFPAGLPLHHSRSFSSSSVPSTPTSARSRSPSISSLETIPDIPDAEAAAVEADRIARLQALTENGEESENAGVRRSSLDNFTQRTPVGFGFTSRDKRKRWSVCGAEKRTDLDLETIWED